MDRVSIAGILVFRLKLALEAQELLEGCVHLLAKFLVPAIVMALSPAQGTLLNVFLFKNFAAQHALHQFPTKRVQLGVG